MTWLAVGVGGAIGSLARHGVSHLIQHYWPLLRFPLATFVVNSVGCLAVGLLAGLLISNRLALSFYWREFVFVGLLGGFTTFSTFGLDTITLARTHSVYAATWNVGYHVIVGLAAVCAGLFVGTRG